MLWDIRALMKPALSIVDLLPHVHRAPALAALRRSVIDGKPMIQRLTDEEKELAFHDANVPLTSPIGAKILKSLYQGGHLRLKKPASRQLTHLDAYIATEPEFRAEVARILAAEEAKRLRLAEIIADPSVARPDELSPYLIDRVMNARMGHGYYGEFIIAGLSCWREMVLPPEAAQSRLRAEPRISCWWMDADGVRRGDVS